MREDRRTRWEGNPDSGRDRSFGPFRLDSFGARRFLKDCGYSVNALGG